MFAKVSLLRLLGLIAALATSGCGNGSSNSSGSISVPTGATYYIPYTVTQGAQQTPTGVFLMSAANPGAEPVRETGASLDTAIQGRSFATLYKWTYDATSQQAAQLQPGVEIYGQGGHLYQLDLNSPAGGPQQLSSGNYASLCSLSEAQQGPYGSSAPQFVTAIVDMVSGDNCTTVANEQSWVVAAGSTAETPPKALPVGASLVGRLWDASTGFVTANLIQNGSELDLYDASFAMQKPLVTATGANSAKVLGEINGSALVDEQTINISTSPKTSADVLYLVNASGVTQIASYAIDSSSSYFFDCADVGGRDSTGFSNFVLGANAGSQFVFSYPTQSGGATIYSLSSSGGIPAVIASVSNQCVNRFEGVTTSNLVINTHSMSGGAEEDLSIALKGPASQQPLVLAFLSLKGTYVFAVAGSQAWITSEPLGGVSVVDIASGNILQTFDSTFTPIGNIWSGYDPNQGLTINTIILGQFDGSSNGLPQEKVEAIDAKTFVIAPVAPGTPMVSSASFYGPGPVLMGSTLMSTNGTYGLAALYSTSTVMLDTSLTATQFSGQTFPEASPYVNMLQATTAYFTN